jgi:DNA repair protein RecO
MGLVETQAIVLQTYKLADADKIVLCMTEKAGLIRGVARGARRLKSRFGASLEPFTVIQLTFFEKETRELVTIKGAEIVKSYFDASGNTDSSAGLTYLLELVKEFAPPHQVDEKLFKMLRACVDFLAKNPAFSFAISAYSELWTLKLTGFLPELRVCGGCGRELNDPSRGRIYISYEGVPLCRSCQGGATQPLSGEAYELLSATRFSSPAEWARKYSEASAECRQVISETARRLVRRALEREPGAGKVSRTMFGSPEQPIG